MYDKIIIIFVLINVPIIFFFKKIIKLINIYDNADNIRKFHKKSVPLFGGFLIFYNFILFIFSDFILNFNFIEIYINTRGYFSLIVGSLIFFLVGAFDDKFELSANKKLSINFFVILFFILIDENLIINSLDFTFMENPVELKKFSILFTVLCILLFMNALNMYDGINLQASFFCILIFLVFIFKGFYNNFNLFMILTLLFFLIYNYSNKAFLGDAGTQILSFIISYLLIKSYNNYKILTPEEIFIILSLPGLDMMRVFLIRLFNGRHPFRADRLHLHYLISDKLNNLGAFIIISTQVIINLLLYYLVSNKILVLIIVIILYILLVLLFKKKNVKP